MSLQLGVLADDLTGGAMVASLLERAGIEAPVVTTVSAIGALPGHVEAAVFAGTYRLAPAEQARAVVREAAEAFRARGCPRLYSKYSATFDSTDTGNIGPVAEELCTVADAPATVFASGFPRSWITVFHGKMFVAGDLLGDSFKRSDPVTPMTESDLVRVLQAQTSWPVGLLGHGVLIRGAEAARAHLAARIGEGERFFIVDAVDDTDVETCAAAVADWPVVTGADALAPALASAIGLHASADRSERRSHPPTPGREVVLAGSCASATLAQLDAFGARHPVRRIDVASLGSVHEEVVAAVDWTMAQDPTGPVAIATSASSDEVGRAQAARGAAGAARTATAVLAEVAAALSARGVRKFVVAGGETTGAVLDALGVDSFEVTAFDDLGGGFCSTTSPEPMTILCKAGALGDPGLLLRGLERMRAPEASP